MIGDGRVRVPDFQRDFRWEIGDIVELVVSMVRGFPAGVLLFWDVRECKEKLAERLFEGVDPRQSSDTVYQVLDGQQRLTSLFQLFYSDSVVLKGGRRRKFFLDIEALRTENYEDFVKHFSERDLRKRGLDAMDEQERMNKQVHEHLLPFDILPSQDKFRQWRDKYVKLQLAEEDASGQEALDRLTELGNAFEKTFTDEGRPLHNLVNYEFHYVELPSDLNLEAVTTIFEKLNTTGQPLNIFEILTAKFYPTVKLRDRWGDTKATKSVTSRFTKDPKDTSLAVLTLKSILLKRSIEAPDGSSERNLECKRKNLLEDLKTQDIMDHWDTMAVSLEKSLNMLNNDYGVSSLEFLPYTTLLVPLSVTVDYIEGKLNMEEKGAAYHKLESWYWSSVLSGAYESSTDTKSKKDVVDMIEWIKGGDVASTVKGFDVKSMDLDEITDGAKYFGILNILLKEGCSDLLTGQNVSTLIKNEPKSVDIHHVFPEKFLEVRYGKTSEQYRKKDSILNKVVIRNETNRHFIRDDAPSTYLQSLGRNNANINRDLQGHLLPLDPLKRDDFDGFVDSRREEIVKKIGSLTKVPNIP